MASNAPRTAGSRSGLCRAPHYRLRSVEGKSPGVHAPKSDGLDWDPSTGHRASRTRVRLHAAGGDPSELWHPTRRERPDRDPGYVARHTTGFDQLKEKVQEYTPQKVTDWTGIPAQDIVRLAREYACTRPAVIRANYGIQRAENGRIAIRVMSRATLPASIS